MMQYPSDDKSALVQVMASQLLPKPTLTTINDTIWLYNEWNKSNALPFDWLNILY